MDFRILRLAKARHELLSNPPKKEETPGRRDFLRTIGLGIIALNPVSRSIKALNSQPFKISLKDEIFSVSRNGIKDWEINPQFFMKGYSMKLEQGDDSYKLIARNLKVRASSLNLSLSALIRRKEDKWIMELNIPELGPARELDFMDWLDGKSALKALTDIGEFSIGLGSDAVKCAGRCTVSVDSRWNISLSGSENVSVNYGGQVYRTDNLSISPYRGESEHLTGKLPASAVSIELTRFTPWSSFVSDFEYGISSLSIKGNAPDVHGVLFDTGRAEVSAALWVSESTGEFRYLAQEGVPELLCFSPYLWFTEYNGKEKPSFYLSGRLAGDTQHVPGRLGSMHLINGRKRPAFEAFGRGNVIESHNCEVMLKSFTPLVKGAVSLPIAFTEPLPLSVNPVSEWLAFNDDGEEAVFYPQELPRMNKQVQVQRQTQQPAGRQTQQPVQRQVQQKNISQLKISYDEIRLEPRRAIRISLLRPEDLVQLDFEFHNFEFYNKDQGGFLQLANAKEKGSVIIWFPTQHTLEEAWFESSKIPAAGKTEQITLPARQLRAGRSRLVYEYDAGKPGFPLVMEELLDWSKFNLKVHPRAYIKLPSISINKPYITGFVKTRTAAPSRDLVETNAVPVDFNLKLMQKRRSFSESDYTLSELNVPKIFSEKNSVTLMPAFSFANMVKEWLKPGPVPDDTTSIEAPALMYISPNQVNDFAHNRELKMVPAEKKERSGAGISLQMRVYENQTGRQGDLVELWHTRLGVKTYDGKVITRELSKYLTIRVLWAFDADAEYKNSPPLYLPFMTSLDASDRHILVHQTSNFSEKFTPVPVPVRKLMLSSLGAWLDWHVFFKLPPEYTTNLNIVEWQHLATLGRDHYVKVVREGYIYPFGHRAALVKITERKFNNETRAAINRQRMYVVILEREVSYGRNDPDNNFIEFPFRKVSILNEYSPDIDHPSTSTLANFPKKTLTIRLPGTKDIEPAENVAYNFYICVGGEKFQFDLSAIDKEGAEHKFRVPLVFVENIIGRTKENVQVIVGKYDQNADTAGKSSFDNQKVAFAESLVEGDTAFETASIIFSGQFYPAKGPSDLKFHPKMKSASIYVRQVEELTGKRDAVGITLTDDSNAGHVFASVTGASVDFTGGSDKSGGFLSPNFEITAISRLQGPIGGLMDDCKNLKFNAEEFFKSVKLPSAKIFGCVDVFSLLGIPNLGSIYNSYISAIDRVRGEMEEIREDIMILEARAREEASDLGSMISAKQAELKAKISELLGILGSSTPKVPGFKTYVTDDAFHAEYRWQPEMKGKSIEVFPELLTIKVDDPLNALKVTTSIVRPFDTSLPSKMDGSARFDNFEVIVAQMIGVGFKYLEFKTGSSQKTDVNVELETVPLSFLGPLSFVNSLQSIIPSSGFGGDGPYIDLTPSGVTAGFSISIPSVMVGMCTIANISLGASITLPFTGQPLLLAFNFCTRENPFLLTISCFGGGGFFRLVSSLKQIESVEAAFEFGASMSLDVGVASGGVSAMGGIYFKSEHTVINGYDANVVILTGYIRLNGHLCIIGLITVSLEFYLAFTANFVSKNGKSVVDKLVGEATLKVKVEVLFFSTSVSVSVRREINGADADPKFTDMIWKEDWEEYCLAFAG